MVAQFVACVMNLLYLIRILFCPETAEEKRGFYIIFFQGFKNKWSLVVLPGRIDDNALFMTLGG